MSISVFDIFKIGIGPSSSHTVGPMRAAHAFIRKLREHNLIDQMTRVEVKFYGSLALTGEGHGTFLATMLGLMGYTADTIDPDIFYPATDKVLREKKMLFDGKKEIEFIYDRDIVILKDELLPYHTNGLTFTVYRGDEVLRSKNYYSVGGGFVIDETMAKADSLVSQTERESVPHRYNTAAELMQMCKENNLSIPELMLENERTFRSDEETFLKLDKVWQTMKDCVKAGITKEGEYLPGHLKVKRRAKVLYEQLSSNPEASLKDPLSILDWVNLYALAVNEQNADFGRIVTAPTNGAAGVIPAVLHYYKNFCPTYSEQGVRDFLLTAGAIGILYKRNASLSGAEVGCQGEVGVACSMAAAGLAQVLGGTVEQIENAAEIGMEHNLGLTCDPVAGLVQVPCIERNAMASVKAINATRMALRGQGVHFVSLDDVMKTMLQTGKDMQSKYKETALGGLAVCITEC